MRLCHSTMQKPLACIIIHVEEGQLTVDNSVYTPPEPPSSLAASIKLPAFYYEVFKPANAKRMLNSSFLVVNST